MSVNRSTMAASPISFRTPPEASWRARTACATQRATAIDRRLVGRTTVGLLVMMDLLCDG
jgi:hypothetical protein